MDNRENVPITEQTDFSDRALWEENLPPFIQISIANMIKSWAIEDSGERDPHWDLWWCELNADINSVEVDRVITSEQAWYLSAYG